MLNSKLEKGEVLAFQTDTVWGFGCNPLDETAVKKIYEIKKRDSKKPLILMSSEFKYLEKFVQNIPDYAYNLIEEYLPGGLTLIFEKSKNCPNHITSNQNTVGIRIPNNKEFFELVNNIEGKVLATTSCNITTENPVKNYQEAKEKFNSLATIIKPKNDTIKENLPSTVILCLKDEYKILRQGSIILK